VLVGREPEQGAVRRLLREARAGSSGVLLLIGDPGIGKSELLDYARRQGSDFTVLRARGVQSEAKVPFGGLLELLRPILSGIRRIPEPQADALAMALALRPARAVERFAVGAATLSLLAAAADTRPVLVLVDDAQWLDGSTGGALLFAFRRLLAESVGVVVTVRSGERSFLDDAGISAVTLTGLELGDCETLLQRRLGVSLGDEVVARLHRETGGNPLALLELGSQPDRLALGTPLDTPLPVTTSLSKVYLARCGALPESARRMLQLAAASDSGDLAVLARAAKAVGLDLADLAYAEKADLVATSGLYVEFCHPLLRSSLYASTEAERRRRFHRALAAALPDAAGDRRAWHLALGSLGPDEAASAALEQAALQARERSAYDVASRAFERAAGLSADSSRSGELLAAAAETAGMGGLTERAIELAEVARTRVSRASSIVEVEHLRGRLTSRMGPVTTGQRLLLAAAELASPIDPERAVLILAEAVNAAFYCADAEAMGEAAEKISRVEMSGATPRSRFFGDLARGMALTFCGDTKGGADLLRAAVGLFECTPELAEDPRALTWAAMGPIWLREADTGRKLIDRAVDACRSSTAIGVLPYLLCHVSVAHSGADRWDEASAGFHEVIALARESRQRADLAFALSRLAWLEARQGDEVSFRAHARAALEIAAELGLGLCDVWTATARGELELGRGDPRRALESFDQVVELLMSHHVGDADLFPGPELVEVNLRLGNRAQACAVASRFAQLARAKGQPWALARAERGLGLVASGEEMNERFTAALDHHGATPDHYEQARTRLAYGSSLRRERQRAKSREQLRSAIDLFDALGARPLSERARRELAATGETARRRDPSTLRQLTPQELQIGLLLASGRTTRDAAAALFLSPKTIEYHLRNAYRKLGISSREELGEALARASQDRSALHSEPGAT
jgi:DNA-binding CsgD family transcriptional regulator